jgi:hypothetical protein
MYMYIYLGLDSDTLATTPTPLLFAPSACTSSTPLPSSLPLDIIEPATSCFSDFTPYSMSNHHEEIEEFGNTDEFWLFGYGYTLLQATLSLSKIANIP